MIKIQIYAENEYSDLLVFACRSILTAQSHYVEFTWHLRLTKFMVKKEKQQITTTTTRQKLSSILVNVMVSFFIPSYHIIPYDRAYPSTIWNPTRITKSKGEKNCLFFLVSLFSFFRLSNSIYSITLFFF